MRRDGKEIKLRQKGIWGQLKRWLIVLTKDGRSGVRRKDWRFPRRRQVLAPVERSITLNKIISVLLFHIPFAK